MEYRRIQVKDYQFIKLKVKSTKVFKLLVIKQARKSSEDTLGLKKFGLGKLWVKNVFRVKHVFWVKKIFLGQKRFCGSKKFQVKSFMG